MEGCSRLVLELANYFPKNYIEWQVKARIQLSIEKRVRVKVLPSSKHLWNLKALKSKQLKVLNCFSAVSVSHAAYSRAAHNVYYKWSKG